jgi:hypothetical protein
MNRAEFMQREKRPGSLVENFPVDVICLQPPCAAVAVVANAPIALALLGVEAGIRRGSACAATIVARPAVGKYASLTGFHLNCLRCWSRLERLRMS